jgi:hypothetical protein
MGVAKVPTKQLGSFKNLSLTGVACDASVYVGAVVRIDDTTGEFVNALADSPTNANAFGICTSKSSSTICDVLLPGSVTEAIYTGLLLNTRYFLSATVAGEFTTAIPTGAGQVIAEVCRTYTSEKVLFLPQGMIRRAL